MEERLQFLATGAKPKKNTDAMKEVLDELKAEGLYYEGSKKDGKKKDKKRKRDDNEDDEEVEEVKPKKKKAKKE
jgi:nucleolar protein 56